MVHGPIGLSKEWNIRYDLKYDDGRTKEQTTTSNIEAIFIWMIVEEAFQCGGVEQGAEGIGGEGWRWDDNNGQPMWLLFAFLVYAEIWHCTLLAMAIVHHRAAAVRWSSMWSVFIVPFLPSSCPSSRRICESDEGFWCFCFYFPDVCLWWWRWRWRCQSNALQCCLTLFSFHLWRSFFFFFFGLLHNFYANFVGSLTLYENIFGLCFFALSIPCGLNVFVVYTNK